RPTRPNSGLAGSRELLRIAEFPAIISKCGCDGVAVMKESPAGLFRGLFETHLHVGDLGRAMEFYGEVLGLAGGRVETEGRAAFYWIGRDRSAMLGIWERPPWVSDGDVADSASKQVIPQHLAFEVTLADLQTAIDRIRQQKIELRNFFDEVTTEPSVFGWMP